MPGELNAVAPGCTITNEDTTRVITSVAVFCCFLNFGACVGSLGAALPQIADTYGVDETNLGYVFIARGVGYFLGTLGSAGLIEYSSVLKRYQMLIVSFGIFCSGLSMAIMTGVHDMGIMYALIAVQGVGFGGVDTLCNIVLPEQWGPRVQPWMQAAHANFGVGGIVGPALVGALGYKPAFALLAVTSFSALGITVAQHASGTLDRLLRYGPTNDRNAKPESEYRSEEGEVSPYVSVLDYDEEVSKVSESRGNSDSQNDPNSEQTEHYLPLSLKLLLASFFFIYVGMEIGFAGWVSSYVLMAGLTESHADAAYVTSVFFSALSIGRILSIPAAVWVSNTLMLRAQLCFTLACSLVVVLVISRSYALAVVSSGLLGLACSSLFPLVMTLVGDYGYTMDASATTMFVVGSTCGEAVIPVFIGVLMRFLGPSSLATTALIISTLMMCIYLLAHHLLTSSEVRQVDNSELNPVSKNADSDVKKGSNDVKSLEIERL